MTMENKEHELLLSKRQVFLYNIPRNIQKRSGYLHRASDWNYENPDWNGPIKLFSTGKSCLIQFGDDPIFGKGKIDNFPSRSLEAVLDSSRYFVVRIKTGPDDDQLFGMGFAKRVDSEDFTISILKHFSESSSVTCKPKNELSVSEQNGANNEENIEKIKVEPLTPEPEKVKSVPLKFKKNKNKKLDERKIIKSEKLVVESNELKLVPETTMEKLLVEPSIPVKIEKLIVEPKNPQDPSSPQDQIVKVENLNIELESNILNISKRLEILTCDTLNFAEGGNSESVCRKIKPEASEPVIKVESQ